MLLTSLCYWRPANYGLLSFYRACDKCDEWYHGHCVALTEHESEKIEYWLCPPCTYVLLSPQITPHLYNTRQ